MAGILVRDTMGPPPLPRMAAWCSARRPQYPRSDSLGKSDGDPPQRGWEGSYSCFWTALAWSKFPSSSECSHIVRGSSYLTLGQVGTAGLCEGPGATVTDYHKLPWPHATEKPTVLQL